MEYILYYTHKIAVIKIGGSVIFSADNISAKIILFA
jgi:hypothetical protein